MFCNRNNVPYISNAEKTRIINNNLVHVTSTQKHLGMFLDFKQNFKEHFENMFLNFNKTHCTKNEVSH